jgi:hypothetical protein
MRALLMLLPLLRLILGRGLARALLSPMIG